MTRVLLVDHKSTGHHVEYASKLLCLLRAKSESYEVHFLPIKSNNGLSQYNDPGVLKPLYINSDRPRQKRKLVRDIIKYTKENEYDILHFLSIDDIIIELGKLPYCDDLHIIANIIGGFFSKKSKLRDIIFKMSEQMDCKTLRFMTPDVLDKFGHYRDVLYLEKLATDISSPLDSIFVPNLSSKQYLNSICEGAKDGIFNVIPDPTELYINQNTTQREAKLSLDLSISIPTVLFFGSLREDKGIDILLKALKKYTGPEFNMIIAGEPSNISAKDIRILNRQISSNIILFPNYIPEEDLPLYFIASDYTVTPYRRSFGRFRPSNVFHKSIGAGTPVIAPRFGNFQYLVEEWELGRLFTPESSSSLAKELEYIMGNNEDHYNPGKMHEYAVTQTYQELARITLKHYNDLF